MKRNLLSLALVCAALAAALSCSRETMPAVQETATPPVDAAYQQGTLNINFDEPTAELIEKDLLTKGVVTKASSSGIAALYEELGIESMERLFPYAGEYEPRTRAEGLHRWYKVNYRKPVSVTKATREVGAIPGVEIAEPVPVIKISYYNDPYSKYQWDFHNDGKLSDKHKAGADINVVPVWENYTVGSEKVIVSVVDGGIDFNHEDLADAYIGGRNFVSGGQVTAHSHGTHVAGTIGAVSNNGKGVEGIAGGDASRGIKGVRLLSCQIFESSGNGDRGGDSSAAIKWGADNGAVISQNSWGYNYDYNDDGKLTGSEYEDAMAATIGSAHKAAVDYFIKYAGCDNNGEQLPDSPMKGGVVIFAAGNDGIENGAPANYEPIIAVGSLAPDFTRAYYSNYGGWVDIAAPGGSAYYSSGQIYSTVPGNKYGWMQGTSMACPHVSGVAALIVSQYGGPGFTNDMLKERLINGANKIALSSNTKIGPLVDAYGSIVYGGSQAPAPNPVKDFTLESKANNIDFTWKVTADDEGNNAYGFFLLATKDKSLFDGLDYSELPAGMIGTVVYSDGAKAGESISGSIGGLDFTTQYYTAVVAFSYGRRFSPLSEIKAVSTQKNTPPVVETTYTGDYKVRSHEVLTIPFSIYDPDGHSFTYKYMSATKSADTFWQNPVNDVYELRIDGPLAEAGVYTAHIIASDKWDSADHIVTFEVLENHPPVAIGQIDDMILAKPGDKFSLDMSKYVEDPDGETLKYTVKNQNVAVLHVNPKDNILNGTALDYGVTSVTVVAADAKNKTAELSFRVAIPDPEKPVTTYPNPVVDKLNIGTGVKASTEVVIRSETGGLVYETVTDVSILEPLEVDLSDQAPGRYVVTVKIGDKEYKQNIVKK